MRYYFTLFFFVGMTTLFSQEAMQVVRCDAVDNRSNIYNLFIDEDNQKWVANENGLVQVLDLNLGQPQTMEAGQQSLLQLPDGNAAITFSKNDLFNILGITAEESDEITTASYHLRRKEMWVGTRTKGLFKLKTEPSLKLVKQYSTKNAKLKSDQINVVYNDPFGRQWVGTDDGLFFGKDDKWDLKERYFNFTKIKMDTSNRVWLLADDLIGPLNSKQVWNPIDLPEAALDGPIVDFTFDNEGFLWVATEVISRIDLATEDYDIYGPAEYYTSQFVVALETDLDGGVWVATEDKGLFLIQPATAMTVNCLVSKALDCDGGGNAAALEVRISGGVAPFEYQWEGGQEGDNPGDLSQGTYIVTVTDSRGTQKIAKAEITDPTVKIGVAMTEQESGLDQKDGKATVEVLQGTAPYTYLWDNGERTEMAIGLTEGKHQVTVTDKNGCSAFSEIEMTRIISSLEAVITQTSENICHGAAQGALAANAQGGKAPFQYQWSTGANTPEISGLKAGSYGLTVTDVLNTVFETTIEVTEPVALLARIDVLSPASTGRADGVGVVALTGGKKPFKYQWTNGEKADTAKLLAPGQHNVTVTDASGCSTIAAIEISENILPLSAEVIIDEPISCFGEAKGALTIKPKGGKGPFEFRWDKATLSGSSVRGLVAGSYTVSITDVTGSTFVENIELTQPGELSVDVIENSPALVGEPVGVIEVEGQGGVLPYKYEWENGSNSGRLENLSAGLYELTISDASGCIVKSRQQVSENVLELLTKIEVATPIKCGGDASGALAVNITGGKGPFQYQWGNRSEESTRTGLVTGIYYVTVTDALGSKAFNSFELKEPTPIAITFDGLEIATTDQADGKASAQVSGGEGPYSFLWDNGETTPSASSLLPGERQVTVTDATGCQSVGVVEVSEDVKTLAVSLKVDKPITCKGDNDAAIIVETKGGKGPFQYQWNLESLEGATIQNRNPGTYLVTVTDAIGQTANAEIILNEPDTMTVEVNPIYPSLVDTPNGDATAVVTGGVPGFSFRWDNGETGPNAIRLTPGIHSVEARDTNGCLATKTFEVNEKLIAGLDARRMETNERIQLALSFDADSTNLKDEFFPILDELYAFLINNPGVTIEIGGHTNNLPPDFYCDEISKARARSTAQYLIKKGIPVFRVFYKGYGKKDPIASNDTPEGRSKNQRVEFKIVSITDQ